MYKTIRQKPAYLFICLNGCAKKLPSSVYCTWDKDFWRWPKSFNLGCIALDRMSNTTQSNLRLVSYQLFLRWFSFFINSATWLHILFLSYVLNIYFKKLPNFQPVINLTLHKPTDTMSGLICHSICRCKAWSEKKSWFTWFWKTHHKIK